MYWPFGATVCMWAILYPSCLCCLMIGRFQWERMLLQTAEVTLIQMSHIQVLAPKGQHMQKQKYEHLNVLKMHEKLRILSPLLIIAWQYVTTWINVFFEMYKTLMKHYEDGKSFFFKSTFTDMQELCMGAIDLRKILGFLSQPNAMKTWLRTFSNQNTFFSNQYYFIDTIQNVLFQVRKWSVDGVEAW